MIGKPPKCQDAQLQRVMLLGWHMAALALTSSRYHRLAVADGEKNWVPRFLLMHRICSCRDLNRTRSVISGWSLQALIKSNQYVIICCLRSRGERLQQRLESASSHVFRVTREQQAGRQVLDGLGLFRWKGSKIPFWARQNSWKPICAACFFAGGSVSQMFFWRNLLTKVDTRWLFCKHRRPVRWTVVLKCFLLILFGTVYATRTWWMPWVLTRERREGKKNMCFALLCYVPF